MASIYFFFLISDVHIHPHIFFFSFHNAFHNFTRHVASLASFTSAVSLYSMEVIFLNFYTFLFLQQFILCCDSLYSAYEISCTVQPCENNIVFRCESSEHYIFFRSKPCEKYCKNYTFFIFALNLVKMKYFSDINLEKMMSLFAENLVKTMYFFSVHIV